MIVHFAASRYDITGNIGHFRNMASMLKAEGHVLAQEWIEPSYYVQTRGGNGIDYGAVNWNEAHKESVEAITKADVVIADTTHRSFSVGYQVALAVQMKKPTLILRREGSNDSYFASGIEAGVLYKEYNSKSLDKLVKDFLQENDIQAKDMRFNFFIDRPIYNYLRWAAYKTGKTKAEILRELVTKEIDKINNVS